jgi:hypothetical protein
MSLVREKENPFLRNKNNNKSLTKLSLSPSLFCEPSAETLVKTKP